MLLVHAYKQKSSYYIIFLDICFSYVADVYKLQNIATKVNDFCTVSPLKLLQDSMIENLRLSTHATSKKIN